MSIYTNIEIINNRIKNEICLDTINKLTDLNLIEEYKKCKSVKETINKLKLVLEKNKIEQIKQELICNDFFINLIPPGTKGVIKGIKFNKIVKNFINNLNLNLNRFDIVFEKKSSLINTQEIPDWYILEKTTNKIIIGMNQLDLWSGGQQLNRGTKYLIDNIYNTDKSKLLCVVCNEIELKNNKNKIYNLFKLGFDNNTLCYINGIERIVTNFFN